MHVCFHTYIHTYVHTYIHTCVVVFCDVLRLCGHETFNTQKTDFGRNERKNTHTCRVDLEQSYLSLLSVGWQKEMLPHGY